MATPLRKRYQNGDIYTRPDVIEDAINNLLNESLENLSKRFAAVLKAFRHHRNYSIQIGSGFDS